MFRQIGDRFRRSVLSFADANDIPSVRFDKDEANLEVMQPHLAARRAPESRGVGRHRRAGIPPACGPPDGSPGTPLNGTETLSPHYA